MTVRSVVVHSVPYARGRLREPLPPCDVLATHSPPKGVLDLCYSGGHGGCRFLRSAVEDAIVRPRLWLCGHIHEGRGHLSDAFGGFRRVPAPGESFGALARGGEGEAELAAGPGGARGTLVVNCATANKGRAAWLEHGATVIRWPLTDATAPAVATAVSAATTPGVSTSASASTAAPSGFASAPPATAGTTTTTPAPAASTASSTSGATVESSSSSSSSSSLLLSSSSSSSSVAAPGDTAPTDAAPTDAARLLAIDLGLKSGAALYDGRGALLQYASFQLLSAAELRVEATKMLRGCSRLVDGGGSAVTHLVIEGGDIDLRRQWEEAVAEELAERAIVARVDDGAGAVAVAVAAAGADGGSDGGDGGGGGGSGGGELRVMIVEPRAWRRALLTSKEQKTGKLAKAAARLIARQAHCVAHLTRVATYTTMCTVRVYAPRACSNPRWWLSAARGPTRGTRAPSTPTRPRQYC